MDTRIHRPQSFVIWLSCLVVLALSAICGTLILRHFHEIEVRESLVRQEEVKRQREIWKWGNSVFAHIEFIRNTALDNISDEEFQKRIVCAMYQIDDWSKCLKRGEYEATQKERVGEYVGIGIFVRPVPLGAEVLDVQPGSPAEHAGLRRKDIITDEIDNDKKIALSGNQKPEDILRGTLGSSVTLSVLRSGKPLSPLTIRPAKTKVVSVDRVERTSEGIGYLHIRFFVRAGETRTSTDMLHAIDELSKKEKLSGLIIDLRGTPGGESTEATAIADMLLTEGVIMHVRNKKGMLPPLYVKPKVHDVVDGAPIVLLVDGDTASAAELLTGALADRVYPRAFVIGESRTYGKGVIQHLVHRPDGDDALITVQEFLTPEGHTVHKKGIIPNMIVKSEEGADAQYAAALLYLKEQRKKEK